MDAEVLKQKEGYAAYPSAFVYDFKPNDEGEISFSRIKQLLFGDWIGICKDTDGETIMRTVEGKEYVQVMARGAKGYIKPEDIQANKILEVNFVDVGQGDGCHVVTPDDKHFLIDAGDSDNMYRFLKWRFNLDKNDKPRHFTVVISHSDSDHYSGFGKIFDRANKDGRIVIDHIYHNTMVESSGNEIDTLGTVISHSGKEYISDLCLTNQQFNDRVTQCSGLYASLLKKSNAPKTGLCKGSGPIYKNITIGLKMEVLGPVTQDIQGNPSLPVFGSSGKKGKTKNGHSVILKLTMGNLKILLGGDLNEPAEDHIMAEYSGVDISEKRDIFLSKTATPAQKESARAEIDRAIDEARKVFQCDIAKSCHHGSSAFTTEFLRAVNPLATIISSGDQEPHVHPRPDTLGTIGKHSRGDRSLIFSTELSRSTVEFVNLKKLLEKIKMPDKERVVTVYGMINVRTDGHKVIIAQRLEKPAPRGIWDIHELVWNDQSAEFEYKQ